MANLDKEIQFSLISPEVKEICKNMIDKPEDWKQTNHTFDHIGSSRISFWTSNGVLFLQPYNGGSTPALNIFEKFYVRRHINKSTLLKISNSLK